MSDKIQVRRGPTTDRVATTFDNGEPVFDTSLKRLFMGDGATLGGIDIAPPVASFKNQLINGNFDFWQRATSGGLVTATNVFVADRWHINANVSGGSFVAGHGMSQQTFTLGQTAVPGNPKFFINMQGAITGGSGSEYWAFGQKIESVAYGSGTTQTLSYWMKANSARNVQFQFVQDFGTGGSPSTAVRFGAQTVALTTSWQKVTLTVAVPSIAGKTLGTSGNDSLVLYMFGQAGATIAATLGLTTLADAGVAVQIARAQFEPGAVATDFEQRPAASELSLCQRYCYVLNTTNNFGTAVRFVATAIIAFIPLPTCMRAAPSCTATGVLTYNEGGAQTVTAVGAGGVIGFVQITGTVTSGTLGIGGYVGTSSTFKVIADSEL